MMPANNLASMVARSIDAHPHRVAIWARGKEVTYRQFGDRAASLATLLRKAGIQPGDRVAILSDRTDELYVAILAALFAGATYVALNPRYPSARNELILKESGARALLIDNRSAPNLTDWTKANTPELELVVFVESEVAPRVEGKRTFARPDLCVPGDALDPFLGADASDLAYVIFTSGSTGRPKGISITHANILAYLENVQGFVGKTVPDDRVAQVSDVTFDVSIHDMFTAWTEGATMISIPENAALIATRFIQEHGITQWFSVPSTARLLGQSGLLPPGSLPTLRSSIFAGEALVASVAETWMKAAPNSPVYNIYGPTEGTISLCGRRFVAGDFAAHEVVSLGEPFPGNVMGIFDPDTNAPLPHGVVGEICFSGIQVTGGYWKDPNLNATRFFTDEQKRRWYKTGDLGSYNTERGFMFVGRVDHQVKIRGFRVDLGEIETVVREAAKVSQVAVIAWPLTDGGNASGCVVFATTDAKADEKSIRAACARKLPDYMVPSRVHFVTALPLNANEKVDYAALRRHPLLDHPNPPA